MGRRTRCGGTLAATLEAAPFSASVGRDEAHPRPTIIPRGGALSARDGVTLVRVLSVAALLSWASARRGP